MAAIPGVTAVEPRVVLDVTHGHSRAGGAGHGPHRLPAGGQAAGAEPALPPHRVRMPRLDERREVVVSERLCAGEFPQNRATPCPPSSTVGGTPW